MSDVDIRQRVEEFERCAPIGRPCRYYRTRPFRECDAIETKIRSRPWVLGGNQVVVAVEGTNGGVSIDHIVFPPKAFVRKSTAGPSLYIGDVEVHRWIGAGFDDEADRLAARINAVIASRRAA